MNHTPHEAALADVLPLIEALELPYLESLQQLLADHIAERRAEFIAEARAKIMQIALSVGMAPEELLAMKIPSRSRPANAGQARYRDPQTGKTWSGLGKVPLWIRDKDRSQFLIGDNV